jgi:hypothetical protein
MEAFIERVLGISIVRFQIHPDSPIRLRNVTAQLRIKVIDVAAIDRALDTGQGILDTGIAPFTPECQFRSGQAQLRKLDRGIHIHTHAPG